MRAALLIACLARTAAPLAAALALGGCFHPLYSASATGGGDVGSALQAVAVDPIPDRIGHYLGNELIFAFNGTGDPVTPKYRLLVTARESVQTALIDTLQQRATSATLVVNADYRLVPAGGGAALTSGTATQMATYDRSAQRYANIRAARDAEIRIAQSLADQIKTRIAAFLAANP